MRVRSLWDAAGAAGWIGGVRTDARFPGMPPASVRALLLPISEGVSRAGGYARAWVSGFLDRAYAFRLPGVHARACASRSGIEMGLQAQFLLFAFVRVLCRSV